MNEFERQVLEGLADLRERMSAIESKVTGREEVCQLHRADMLAIKCDIDGNGKPGLKKLVQDLTRRLDIFETKVVTWSAAGSFIGGGVMFLIANWDNIKKMLGGN